MNRTNSIIKFDLHIHSNASAYKESNGIVDNSTKENLDVLFQKLNEKEVALFSITDHNRFDADLYKEIRKKLSNEKSSYPNILNVVAGVEFDVKLEENMEKCHIITIFDAKDEENYIKIQQKIKPQKERNEYYQKEEFENLLKNIGLNVILIANQRKDLNNHDGHHNSLSDSCEHPEKIIKVGYIDALEFQKPKVEGILINNLKDINIPCTLFSGSDCHDWSVYPAHDNTHATSTFVHSKAQILPTFKGLLMAITGPETRFNRKKLDAYPIKSIQIQGKDIPLVAGINVIIGENGSGKTTLLQELSLEKSKLDDYAKKIINTNKINHVNGKTSFDKKYIQQNEIVKNFYINKLFENKDDNNFKEIDNKDFLEKYEKYQNNLYETINKRINDTKLKEALNDVYLSYENKETYVNYFINVIDDFDKEKVDNIHLQPYNKIRELKKQFEELEKDPYFIKYKTLVDKILEYVNEIYTTVKEVFDKIEIENKVRNSIETALLSYKQTISSSQSTQERESLEAERKRNQFISCIVDVCKKENNITEFPIKPSISKGYEINKRYGFNFNSEANYNGRDMQEDFLRSMFTSEYRNEEAIKGIKSKIEFQKAIMNCGKEEEIKSKWNANYKKFIDSALEPKHYISEETGNDKIGNTLGEMSLAYYKYCTSNTTHLDLLIVDQPEDNISNSNIRHNLIKYFNYIRHDKQMIFVTHNPLLVVNIDADNVIFLQNKDGVLNVQSGCLEYEDNETNILKIVAENMDGGKETIERRLKVYGKNY